MNESLTVPTATTFRELPVGALEARRRRSTPRSRPAGRSEKSRSPTSSRCALVRAAKQPSGHGAHLRRCRTARRYRVTPDGINLGLAVDVERRTAAAGWWCRSSSAPTRWTSPRFHAAYEALVEKARGQQADARRLRRRAPCRSPIPGGLGTVASVPRLMAGQGSIIAVGAIGYPPEFADVSARSSSRELGISKVMTITSTYDHRVIQGAESGEFLRDGRAAAPGRARGSTRRSSRACGSALPTAGAGRRRSAPRPPRRRPSRGRRRPTELSHVAAAMALVKAFRTHGHLAAQLDPLGSEPIGDPALDPGPLGPHARGHGRRSRPTVLRVAVPGRDPRRGAARPAGDLLRHDRLRGRAHRDHEERVWLRETIESGALPPAAAPRGRSKRLLERLTEVEALERFLHKAYLGQKRFSIEGVDMLVPMLDLAIEHGRRRRARAKW